MKKSIIFLVLLALTFFSFQAFAVDSFPAGTKAFTTEVTADTKAVEPVANESWLTKILKAMSALFLFALSWLAKNSKVLIPKATEVLAIWLKSWNHWRGSAVCADRIALLLATRLEHLRVKLLDGSITKAELEELRKESITESMTALKDLYGFYKPDMLKWVTDQVGVQLGKFLFRSSDSSGLKSL